MAYAYSIACPAWVVFVLYFRRNRCKIMAVKPKPNGSDTWVEGRYRLPRQDNEPCSEAHDGSCTAGPVSQERWD